MIYDKTVKVDITLDTVFLFKVRVPYHYVMFLLKSYYYSAIIVGGKNRFFDLFATHTGAITIEFQKKH